MNGISVIGTTDNSRLSLTNIGTPDELEQAADQLESAQMPAGALLLTLLCATLCRRVAKLKREKANGKEAQ